METYSTYFLSPVGWLKIATNGQSLLHVSFQQEPGVNEGNELNTACQLQLEEYFQGRRSRFDIPVDLQGSDFQKKVWSQLQQIPFGITISYQRLAVLSGNPLLTRAVGQANAVNPVAVIIPCHRVIGADGSMVGYAGGLWRKQWLLDHERNVRFGVQADLF